MNPSLGTPDLNGMRASKARLGSKLSPKAINVFYFIAGILLIFGILGLVANMEHWPYFSIATSLLLWVIAKWFNDDLRNLPKSGTDLTSNLSRETLALLKPGQDLSPLGLWQSLHTHWQNNFICNHLFLSAENIASGLSKNVADSGALWQTAAHLAEIEKNKLIEPGHVGLASILVTPPLVEDLKKRKITADDLASIGSWLNRIISAMNAPKNYFGGIGRDWASGFTPELNQFGQNISSSIEAGGTHYESLTSSDGVMGIKNAFAQGANAIALVGPDGIGKTSHVYALAQNLLAENSNRELAHSQIIGLNPSSIISASQGQGRLEEILLRLMTEAVHAGNIVLFLDDAQLFFKNGPGSFDATQILLPVVQSRRMRIVLAMSPHDYQDLKAQNPAFANLLTPVMLAERSEADVMEVLEDTALHFEGRSKTLITYEAIKEAYRLSGRYDQDVAYPGKAINLLEQALSHAENGVITAVSVQQAIEQTRGVRLGDTAPAEAQELLNLEDRIHERMINQSRAVQVVSAALRRARAGVSNPNRPIGSFLFLGPTGVGKTELSKAIASTYFSSEANMVRLDMSEYQQPEDVKRLLSGGQGDAGSLILSIRQQPFTVVLLDEIEKAHPNILNLLLQLLDEGQLTDSSGRPASFKDAIIIATSNAGANTIREHIEKGEKLESFEAQFTDELINSGQFKPELLNRFDEIVLFRPLTPAELSQVVQLMVKEINVTLANQNITVELTDEAIVKIVQEGNDPRLGARPMRRTLQRTVEDNIANQILAGKVNPGDHVKLDVSDLSL